MLALHNRIVVPTGGIVGLWDAQGNENSFCSATSLWKRHLSPCHPDRSEAQWRDLRFLGPRLAQVGPCRVAQFDKPSLFRSSPTLQLFLPRNGVLYKLVGFQKHETVAMVGLSEAL